MWENPNARDIDYLKIVEKKKMEAEEQKNKKNNTSIISLTIVLFILFLISTCCTFGSIYVGGAMESNVTSNDTVPQAVSPYRSVVNISAVRSSVDPTIVWIKNTNAMMTFKDGTTSTTRVSTCENTTFCTMSIDWSNLATVSIRVCMYPENPQDNPPCQTVQLLQTTETVLLKVDG